MKLNQHVNKSSEVETFRISGIETIQESWSVFSPVYDGDTALFSVRTPHTRPPRAVAVAHVARRRKTVSFRNFGNLLNNLKEYTRAFGFTATRGEQCNCHTTDYSNLPNIGTVKTAANTRTCLKSIFDDGSIRELNVIITFYYISRTDIIIKHKICPQFNNSTLV